MIWHVAKREALEQLRQRTLVGALVVVYLMWAAVITLLFLVLELVRTSEDTFLRQLADAGVVVESLDEIVLSVVHAANLFNATQLMIFAAVLCGHSILHDRQCGTLAFLLQAPLSRAQLLVAKVIGALLIPSAIYVVVGGAMMAVAVLLLIGDSAADSLPFSAGWTLSFVLTTPIWSFVVGGLCAMVSASARDVRTAQMLASLLTLLATSSIGMAITAAIPEGAEAQLGLSIAGLVVGAAIVVIGSAMISRDLSR